MTPKDLEHLLRRLDGREQVVTRAEAVKLRAEDGRAVHGVDLSPFIDHLPFGRSTRSFTSGLASGSTSQAAALDPRTRRGRPRIRAGRRDALLYSETETDLRALEQIADAAQVRAIGRLLALAHEQAPAELEDPPAWFAERLGADWASLQPRPDGDLARPRLAEVMAVLNRLRTARFLPAPGGN